MEQDGGVLAAAEEEHRPLGLGRHLPYDEHGQGLEQIEVPEGALHRSYQRSDRGLPVGVDPGVVRLVAECGGGVHIGPVGSSRIMTILVMYTNGQIRSCVKGDPRGPVSSGER